MFEKPFWAGVFKAQVKCCRNELKHNCFPDQIIPHQLSRVWNVWPLTLTSSKPTVYEVTFIIKGLCWYQFEWSAAAAFALLCHLKSDFNESQIQYFHCCLNRRGINQIQVFWFKFSSSHVNIKKDCICCHALWLAWLKCTEWWAPTPRVHLCLAHKPILYVTVQHSERHCNIKYKRSEIMCVGLDPEVENLLGWC